MIFEDVAPAAGAGPRQLQKGRTQMSRRWIALALALCAGSVAAQETQPARGHLILNGGGDKPRDVMSKFVELAGGPSASILIVPTASEESDTGDYYRKLLHDDFACTNVTPLKLRDRRDSASDTTVKLVNGAGGIWFAGGDQRRIISALRETPVGTAVADAYRRGAVLGGTSAGTACMSGLMLTGEGDFTKLTAKNVELYPGLGFFPGAIVDQHFFARQRENRLFTVILEHPDLLGIGIDEATAVWLRPDLTFQVLGKGWVMILDPGDATVVTQTGEKDSIHLGVRNLRVHVLLPGDLYDLRSRKILEKTTTGVP